MMAGRMTELAKQASARASAVRKRFKLNRLVRIEGDQGGVYSVSEIAERLGMTTDDASTRLMYQRKLGPVTWARLARPREVRGPRS